MDKTYERDGVRNIVRELRTEVTGDYEATFRISYEDFKVTLSRGQHCCGSMQTGVKAHAKEHNSSQHCCVLLGFFGQQCCIRLHWPKTLTGFKLCATSANKCQQMPTNANIVVVPCKRTQHVGPNSDKNVAPVCMGPNVYGITLGRPSYLQQQINQRGVGSFGPPPPLLHRFSKHLHIKAQPLACKQLWVMYLLSITTIKF